ncbi:ATP-binding protein [Terribacillus saccharophilus]
MTMQISGGHIYDFGKWHEYTFEFEDSSLVIIQGENEAGKSTLKAFLIYILFGMRSREIESYRPRTGGTPGGRLNLRFPDGEVVVERILDQHNGQAVCYVGSEQKDQQWLENKLDGMDASIFRQVFTLDTEALVSLQLTDKEQLGKVLLDAGQTGSADVHKLEKKLQQELQQLFRPQGRKPKINAMLHAFSEQERLVQELTDREAAYLPDKEKLQEILEKTDELQKRKAELRAQISVQKQVLQAIPWQKKEAFAKEQLKQLASVETFPSDGIAQQQQIQQQLQPLEAQFHVHTKESASIHKDLVSAEDQLLKDELYKELYQLAAKTDWTAYMKRTQLLEEERYKLQNQLASAHVSYPYPDEFAWNSYIAEATGEWRLLQEKMMILDAESERIQQSIAAKRQEIDKVDHLQDRIDQSLISEKEYRELHTKKDIKRAEKDISKVAFSPIGLLLVFAVLLSGIGILTANWLLAGSGILLLVGAVMHWRFGHQPNNQPGNSSYASEKLAEQQELRVRWRQLEEQRHPLEVQLMELQQSYSMQIKNREKLEQETAMHIEKFSFLTDVPLVHWEKAVQEWKTKEQLAGMLHKVNQEYEERQLHYTSTIDRLRDILNLPMDLPSAKTIEQAEYVIETQQKLRHTKEQLLDRQQDIQQHIQKLDKQLKPLQEQKANLFVNAGAKDDKQFVYLAEQYRIKTQLMEELEHYQLQIRAILPDQHFSAEEMEHKQDKVEQVIASLETEQEFVEEELDKHRQRAATLQVKLADLESDTTASAAYHELQGQKQVLTTAGRKWAVRKLAYDMLYQTKRSFQEERFPRVLSEASSLFSKVADQYKGLVLTETGSLVVKDRYSRNIAVEQLSRGTIEQLYLCLRLALSRHLGVQQSFPLLIDDAFSHTDHERRERFLPILQAAADVQQIILFTWEQPTFEWTRQSKLLHLEKTQKTGLW